MLMLIHLGSMSRDAAKDCIKALHWPTVMPEQSVEEIIAHIGGRQFTRFYNGLEAIAFPEQKDG